MALIKLGPTVASASGSVGGCVFSHNRYGSYIRQRIKPVNTNTTQQQAVRSAFGGLASAWNTDLDQSERDAWDAYAAQVSRPNSLGDPTYFTGLNWFIAVNAPRIQSGLARIDDAPITFNGTLLSPCTISADASDQAVKVTGEVTDEWATDPAGHLFVSVSRGKNETRLFLTGPFRLYGTITGTATPPLVFPLEPQPATPPFALVAGQRVNARLLAQSADGRLSAPQIATTIVIA